MDGQMTRMKIGCRERERVMKPRKNSSNKYPKYTGSLDLTLNPSAVCSPVFPIMLQPQRTPKNLYITSFPICCNKNLKSVHCQLKGLNHAEVGQLKRFQPFLPPWPDPCFVQQPLSAHTRAAQQENSYWLGSWPQPPQGRRKEERHRGRISSLTFSKQSHLITELKVIIPQEREKLCFFPIFFLNLGFAMSW